MDQLEKFNKLLNGTKQRDKVTKLLQSFSKIAADYYQGLADVTTDSKLKNEYIISVSKANSFDGGIGSARKVSRFFNFIANYIELYKFIQQKDQNLESYVKALSSLCYSQYFFYDSLSWFAKLKLLSNEKPTAGFSFTNYYNNSFADEYSVNSSRFWLFAIFFSMILSIQKLLKALNEKDEKEKKNQIVSSALSITTLSCDAVCALHSSQFYTVSKSTFGILSLISASIGIYESW